MYNYLLIYLFKRYNVVHNDKYGMLLYAHN